MSNKHKDRTMQIVIKIPNSILSYGDVVLIRNTNTTTITKNRRNNIGNLKFFKVPFSGKLLVLGEYLVKSRQNLTVGSLDRKEQRKKLKKFSQGDGLKLRNESRKFFFHYGIKVEVNCKKFTEPIFKIFLSNTYLD